MSFVGGSVVCCWGRELILRVGLVGALLFFFVFFQRKEKKRRKKSL